MKHLCIQPIQNSILKHNIHLHQLVFQCRSVPLFEYFSNIHFSFKKLIRKYKEQALLRALKTVWHFHPVLYSRSVIHPSLKVRSGQGGFSQDGSGCGGSSGASSNGIRVKPAITCLQLPTCVSSRSSDVRFWWWALPVFTLPQISSSSGSPAGWIWPAGWTFQTHSFLVFRIKYLKCIRMKRVSFIITF